MEAIRIQQVAEKKGELFLKDLPIEKGQQIEVLLLLESMADQSERPCLTARQLLNSDLIGLWKDRTDIKDSAVYARQLREQAQTRSGIGEISNDNSG